MKTIEKHYENINKLQHVQIKQYNFNFLFYRNFKRSDSKNLKLYTKFSFYTDVRCV